MNETTNSNRRISKRRRACPDNGTVTFPSIPLTSNATHTTPGETLYHSPKQSQQSSASCDPSLQRILTHPNPPHLFDYQVSSGGCDGINIDSRNEMATDSTAHQSSSHFYSGPSALNQGLHNDNQCGAPPKDTPVSNPDTQEDDGYNSVATVQLFQNTPVIVVDQSSTGTAEIFNSHSHAAMGDTSTVFIPPRYIYQGDQSSGTLRQEQIGNMGFNPSIHVSQGQMGNTGFDPSSYVSQGQMGDTGFDPSIYVCQGQVEDTGFNPSSCVYRENMSFGTQHDEHVGDTSVGLSNFI